jgi:hypothetical protein
MKKYTLITIILFLSLSYLSAEDPFGDIFSDEENINSNIVDENSFVPADNSQSDVKIDFSGNISTEVIYYFDAAQVGDNEVVFRPESYLDLQIYNKTMEGTISLYLSPQKWTDNPDTILYDLINELYLKTFFSIGYLELGLMKIEWGSADGIHVLNPLSYWDLRYGFSFDINSLYKARELLKMNFYVKDSGLLELVYKPFFTSYIFAQEGRWSIGTENIPNLHEPDTTTLEYSQVALRLTNNFNRFDIGIQYYYGYLPDPGISSVFIGGDPLDPNNYDNYIYYDRAHLFGLEGGTSLGVFTFWLEAGYWLTGDTAGTDPTVFNNRIVYLPGFDFSIPRTNLYFNVQIMGSYTLNTEGLLTGDVDDPTGTGSPAHSNMLLIVGDYSFNNNRTKIRLGGMWSIEERSYIIMPELFWSFNDYLDFSISGQIIGGEDNGTGMLQSWKNNDNLRMELIYTF